MKIEKKSMKKLKTRKKEKRCGATIGKKRKIEKSKKKKVVSKPKTEKIGKKGPVN